MKRLLTSSKVIERLMVSSKVAKRLLTSFKAAEEIVGEIYDRWIDSLILYKWSSKRSGPDNQLLV